MKKLTKNLLLVLAMVLLCFAVSIGASAETDGYYTYTVENGEATITDVDESISGDVVIPETFGEYTVTEIHDYAFSWQKSLTSITIPDSVVRIGFKAFTDCYSLTNVIMGNGVTVIDGNAFTHCRALKSVSISESVTSIGEEAFSFCASLVSVAIPESVTTIGDMAFLECVSLESIIISESVTTIGDSVFDDCMSLKNITVDKNNEYYSSDEYGVLYNKDKTILIQYPSGSERTTYTIPDTVKEIGEKSFFFCLNLKEIIIPESVEKVGGIAFVVLPYAEKICVENMSAEISFLSLGANEFKLEGISKEDFLYNYKMSAITDYDEYWAEIEKHIIFIENEEDMHTVPIYCHSGSTAETYALENNSPYILTHFYEDEWTYDYDNMIRTRKCKFCDETETEKIENAEADDNEITEPETPDMPDIPSEPDTSDCTCPCHSNPIVNLVFTIINFIMKLFGKAPCCPC